jgi:hypothetical protein
VSTSPALGVSVSPDINTTHITPDTEYRLTPVICDQLLEPSLTKIDHDCGNDVARMITFYILLYLTVLTVLTVLIVLIVQLFVC